uniref:Pre-mRNA-splicing factor SLU7 n=1 Tax=Eptatretus burgeri TaxID=7764 RepID=A0A8C4NEE1_EPTBU
MRLPIMFLVWIRCLTLRGDAETLSLLFWRSSIRSCSGKLTDFPVCCSGRPSPSERRTSGGPRQAMAAGVVDLKGVDGGTDGSDEPRKLSREDWRKRKELEEQRKLGNAPAEVDEEGRDINPHIPQYISSVPWYVDPSKRPTLKHQRPQPERQTQLSDIQKWYKRGVVEGRVITYFRKGACENCGSMTHKRKDCMERPRKIGAQFTGKDIAPDEPDQPILLQDFDGKRDRWNGYNPAEHIRIVEEYAKVDIAKRQLKAQNLQDELRFDAIPEHLDKEHGDESDEDKYADDVDMPGQNFDSKRRITVRNLRIREDTAKYLRNLDPNSAYYDPKTRSMRENPYSGTGCAENEVTFAGDNFVRCTGDTAKMAQAQLFAWDASERGTEVHLQADPTKLQLLGEAFCVRKEDYKKGLQESILEKYGGAKYLDVPPRELLLAQSEDYVEYSRHGTILQGQERAVARSKYAEDVFINNHTAVWGSYWRVGQWGYKCCHSLVKQSYCTGEAGRNALVDPSPLLALPAPAIEESPVKSLVELHQEKRKEEMKKKKKKHKKNKGEESDEEQKAKKEKQERLQKALKAEEQNQREADELLGMDERKRHYHSRHDIVAPTEEEIEAWQMKRKRPDDPMSSLLFK